MDQIETICSQQDKFRNDTKTFRGFVSKNDIRTFVPPFLTLLQSLLFGMEGDLVDAGPWSQARPPCDPHHTVPLVQAQPHQLPAIAPVPPTLVPTVENL